VAPIFAMIIPIDPGASVTPPIYYPPPPYPGVPAHPIYIPPPVVGGGPIQPQVPVDPGYSPPWARPQPGVPTHPIYTPPPEVDGGPVEPPGGWKVGPGGKAIWKAVWVPNIGWVVAAVPIGEHTAPSEPKVNPELGPKLR